ncbi:MAG: DUF2314 domain-containing protein [Verrucomicrobiota bacterium]|nr:DUF2314 domain-containing protein [Verrucomicrobiota bacterium]
MKHRPLFVGILAWCSLVAAAAATSELESLTKQAGDNYSTKEGQRYLAQFEKAIFPVFSKALQSCTSSTPDTKDPASVVFLVAADGTVRRMLYSTEIPFGVCLGSKLRAIKTLPKPPRDNWAVALGAANHHQAEQTKGPPDKPVAMGTSEKLAAYDRAIAPYVAKARATYPDAKKRFLAGLPAGYRFSVRVPLSDPDGKREDSFLAVEKISGGKITGTIASQLTLVSRYKEGQRITVAESQIDNWVIVRPDGTEEGNAVGKFLDHYKPQ